MFSTFIYYNYKDLWLTVRISTKPLHQRHQIVFPQLIPSLQNHFWMFRKLKSSPVRIFDAILLDMYGVVIALTTSKSDSSLPMKQIEEWTHVNKVCRHTLSNALSNNSFDVYCFSYKEAKDICDSLILKYIVEDVVRQRFVIGNYHRWEMIETRTSRFR